MQWEDCTGPRPTSSTLLHSHPLLSRHLKQSTSGLRLLAECLNKNKARTYWMLEQETIRSRIRSLLCVLGVVSWARLTPTMLASVTSREIRPNRVHMVEMCWKSAGINGLLVEAKFERETEY